MMMFKNILSLGLAAALLLSSASVAIAKDKKDTSWELRKQQIEETMIDSYGKGTIEDVKNALSDLGVDYIGSSTDVKSSNTTDIDISPLSSGSMVSVTTTYYRDRYSGNYLVQGFWRWSGTYDSNCSPYDAFGLWMSKVSDGTPATGQKFESQGCTVYDNNGTPISGNMWASDFDVANAGVAWTVSDVYNSSTKYFVGDKGQGWIWMTAPPSQSVYLRAKLTHTYMGGTISGIMIGTAGLTFTLSPTTQNWSAINPITSISSWPTN